MRHLVRHVALALVLVATPALARKHAEGAPSFKAGDPPAVWIWHDAGGWHLRVTTGGKAHTFQGIVRTFSGPIDREKATRAALASKISTSGSAVRFELASDDSKAAKQGGLDGFDWDAASECMTFEVRVDQRMFAKGQVRVGAKSELPTDSPFDACR